MFANVVQLLACWTRDVLMRLRTGQRGSQTVEYAVIIGFVLLLAVALWPLLQQLFHSVVSKWQVP
jgi:Flp pilus assembly pilin Flp